MGRKPVISYYLRISLLFSALFFHIFLFAQSTKKFYHILNLDSLSYDSKIAKLDSLIPSYETNNKDSLEYLYNDYAYWLFDQGEIKKAIAYGEKSTSHYKKKYNSFKRIGQLNLYDLGFYYLKNQQPSKSIARYSQAIKHNDTSDIAGLSYYELGKIYKSQEDYYTAFDYYKLCVKVLKQKNNNRRILRNAYQQLSFLGFRIKTLESLQEGEKYGIKADSLLAVTSSSYKDSFNIKLNLAYLSVLRKKIDLDKASFYFQQCIGLTMKRKDSLKTAMVYQGLADLYNIIDTTQSLSYYKKAISLTKRKDSLLLSDLKNGIGHTYSIMGLYKKSITSRKQALSLLTGFNFDGPEKMTTPFLIDFKNKTALLFYIRQLGESYLRYYEASKEPSYLKKSMAYFKIADEIIDLLKINANEFKSRHFWQELASKLYDKAVYASFLKNDVENAFYYMEKSKALLLLQDIAQERLKQNVGLNDREKRIESEMEASLAKIRNQLEDSDLDTDSLKRVEVTTKLKINVFRDSLGIQHKDFKVDPKIASLKSIQQNLLEDEVVLEYHITQKDGNSAYTELNRAFLLVITHNEVTIHELVNFMDIESTFNSCFNSLKKPFQTKQDKQKYLIDAHKLYNSLLPTKKIRELIQQKKMIIAPDDFLAFLPFEALVVDLKNGKYLIEENVVQYIYSNSFLKNVGQKSSIKNPAFLAIAPTEFGDNNLIALNSSAKEIEVLPKYYKGKTLLKTKASKENFLSSLSGADIIHLATHANSNIDKTPWITFYDSKITLNDLYTIDNTADLVLLSACNTTIGKYETGEGVMSLARGFFYSGSKSVISSLWNINDKASSEIISKFYKNLSSGVSKSNALREAKLSYLKEKNLSDASPYYWAPMILIGNDTPIPSANTNLDYLITLLFLLLVGITVAIYISKKRQNI